MEKFLLRQRKMGKLSDENIIKLESTGKISETFAQQLLDIPLPQ